MKKIPLTQGLFALVDDQDFEAVSKFRWHTAKRRKAFYAARKIKVGVGVWTNQYLHRFLVPEIDGNMVVGNDKRCPGCREIKPSSEWYRDSSTKDGLTSCCSKCHRERSRKKYLKNPEKALAATKKWRAKNPLACRRLDLKKVGLTPEEYDRILKESKGVCALCKRIGKRLYADHNHKTGKFRAFLCLCCNTALGKFQDDPRMLRAAAEYVETHL